MAAWIGLVGVVIGTVLGGVLSFVLSQYQAQDADRRLKTQLEHADQQREQDRRIAVRNESAQPLRVLVDTLGEVFPSIAQAPQVEMDEAVFTTLLSVIQRAAVSMTAIGDTAALDDVYSANELAKKIFDAEGIDTVGPLLNQVTGAMAAIERHYTRLKLGD